MALHIQAMPQSKIRVLRHDAVQLNLTIAQRTVNCLKNREALKPLEQELSRLQAGYGIAGTAMTGGLVFTNPLVAGGGLLGTTLILKRVEKVSRIIRVSTTILDAFKSQDVQIYPKLEVPGHNPIDIFVRFPYCLFIISIRSMGNAEIVFKEANETLYVKRKSKGSKRWLPDPLLELSEYQSWLKNNRQKFKMSSKEVRKPLAKVLVLSGGTQIYEHREELYSPIGEESVLALSRKGTAFVIREAQVTNFITAYLARYDPQEA